VVKAGIKAGAKGAVKAGAKGAAKSEGKADVRGDATARGSDGEHGRSGGARKQGREINLPRGWKRRGGESAGADEVIDHTTTAVTVAEAVDVLLNLARIDPEALVALAAQVRPGGVVVNTVPTIPTPADDERGVRAVGVFVRSDAQQLSQLVDRVDRGELRVDVAERVPLADLPELHARAAAGALSGKAIILVGDDDN
jgi:Zinc-binding dehydrogenase